jgi:hypothetical protein
MLRDRRWLPGSVPPETTAVKRRLGRCPGPDAENCQQIRAVISRGVSLLHGTVRKAGPPTWRAPLGICEGADP